MPYSYLWDFGDGATSTTGPTVSHTYTSTGTFTVTLTATDASNPAQVDQQSYTVTVTNPIVADIQANRTSVTCANPSATLTATGGDTYLWSTGAMTAEIAVSPTTTTTYSVTVTGANGCTAVATQEIGVDQATPSAGIQADRTTVTCANPSATLTATGGGMYLWSTGETASQITVSPATTTTYSVTVTGANGCTAVASQQIGSDQAVPNAGIQANRTTVTCANPSATLTASGGGTYLWSTGETAAQITVSPTTTTTYSVTVTAANGCTAVATQEIGVDQTAPSAGIQSNRTTVTCANPSATLTATGGGTYLWSTGAMTAEITVSPTTTTTYSVTVTGANGCTAVATQQIGVDQAAPSAGIQADRTTVTCANPSATLTATGGGTYLWSTGETAAQITVSPASTTTYSVTVTAANGCTAVAQQEIGVSTDVPQADISENRTTLTCANPSATLTASGGGTYLWSTGETAAQITVSPTTTTTYSVTVTAANGCTAVANQQIGVDQAAPSAGIQANRTTVTCANPSATLTASGGGTYLWSTGAMTAEIVVSPTTTTTYSVTVTGANGCTAVATQEIGVDQATPSAGIQADRTTVTCANPSATLTATGGGTYLWSTGETAAQITVSPASTTTYSVTVTAANGCTAVASQQIGTDQTAPNANIQANRTEVTCINTSATLTASGGGMYLWSTGETAAQITVSPTTTTTYSVTVTSPNGCTVVLNQEIRVNQTLPDAPTLSPVQPNCFVLTGSITVTAPLDGGGNDYEYSLNGGAYTDNTVFGDLSPNTYSIVARLKSTGCISPAAQQTLSAATNCVFDQYCTQTMGGWGNKGGKYCYNGSKQSTTNILTQLLSSPLTVGSGGNTYTIPAGAAGVKIVIDGLPAGGSPATLVGGVKKDKKGTFENVLLGQTIALSLNVRRNPELNSFVLTNTITTLASTGCVSGSPIPGTEQTVTIPQSVLDYLDGMGGRTVANLLTLANMALGGQSIGGISLSAVNEAVSAVNEAFTDCRFLATTPTARISAESAENLTLKAVAYPNPHNGRVFLQITSPVAGTADIDMYTVGGTKVDALKVDVKQGVNEPVGYDVKSNIQQLIYRVTVGGKAASGVIISGK
ncbi:hypothetical protein GCM10023189_19990 [Nibrella saemangeumensis]|uniref:PKD domain-containing protein n=2 Tax=Nibrella saemangeumensis TaxID=1084526 RepID=A0ABP8MS04_9BACT